MFRRLVLLTSLAAVLIVGSQAAAYAGPCQNNPGCLCINGTYTGGDDCRLCGLCSDCLIIIC